MQLRRVILFLSLLVIYAQSNAQVNRYIVHFTDKNNSAYNVNSPLEFLSQRAIDRREKQGIYITEQDIPVNSNYIAAISNLGASVFYKSKWLNVALVEMDASVKSQLESLPYVSEVEFVAPGSKLNGRISKGNYRNKNYKNRVTTGESDFQLNFIGADDMHKDGYEGGGILIAIMDAGFLNVQNISQFDHLFQSNQIKHTFNYTSNNEFVYDFSDHGTRVFSLMAAEDAGFIGVVPKADYMLFVTEDVPTEFRIEEYNWLFAAEFADSAGVDVINTSLGYNTFDDPSMDYTYSDLNGSTTVISKAASKAADTGMVVVVGSGNEGNKSWKYIIAPGDVEKILTVGSVTRTGSLSAFSSIGPTADGRIKPDLVALGSSVSVIDGNGNIIYSSGTSFSAPQVAGLVAGLWEQFPELTATELMNDLRMSGNQALYPDEKFGYGIPNYLIFQTLKNSETRKNTFTVYPNPVTNNHIKLVSEYLIEDQFVHIVFLSPDGRLIRELDEELDLIDNAIDLDLTGLPQGLYILQVKTTGRAESFRIIKSL